MVAKVLFMAESLQGSRNGDNLPDLVRGRVSSCDR
jgi:hypothetical protein